MYNSVIFASTSLSEPQLYVVTKDFFADPPGAPYDVSKTGYSGIDGLETDSSVAAEMTARLQRLKNSASTVRLETAECLKTYGISNLISEWGDALVVITVDSNDTALSYMTNGNVNTSLIYMSGFSYSDTAICNPALECQGDSFSYTRHQSASISVSHCLAFTVPQHCKLRFSVGLMVGVVACNLIKIICMSCAVWKLDRGLLVTLGDAIESFLENTGQFNLPLEASPRFGHRPLHICLVVSSRPK